MQQNGEGERYHMASSTEGEQNASSQGNRESCGRDPTPGDSNTTGNNSSNTSSDNRMKQSIIIAITTGKYAREQENVGFLTLVLRAVQNLVHSVCLQQEVHVHLPSFLSMTDSNDDRRRFMVFSEWESAESYLTHGGSMTIACSNDQDTNGVPREVAFTAAADMANNDSDLEEKDDSSLATQGGGFSPDVFESVTTDLWWRIEESHDGVSEMKKNEGRSFASYVAVLEILSPPETQWATYKKVLIDGRDHALRESGCIAFQILIKRSRGGRNNSKEGRKFLIYSVFGTVHDFAHHVQHGYSFFNPQSAVFTGIERGNDAYVASCWRRADFPTAPKSTASSSQE